MLTIHLPFFRIRNDGAVMIQTQFSADVFVNFFAFQCEEVATGFKFDFTHENHSSFVPTNLGKMGVERRSHLIGFF